MLVYVGNPRKAKREGSISPACRTHFLSVAFLTGLVGTCCLRYNLRKTNAFLSGCLQSPYLGHNQTKEKPGKSGVVTGLNLQHAHSRLRKKTLWLFKTSYLPYSCCDFL